MDVEPSAELASGKKAAMEGGVMRKGFEVKKGGRYRNTQDVGDVEKDGLKTGTSGDCTD